jgi:transcriptional regulator with XRE-family HTH domain
MTEIEDHLTEYGKRLRDVRRVLDISQKDFAAQLFVSPSFLSEIESGKTKPGYNFLLKLAAVFDVNPAWLLLGKGAMFFKDETASTIANDEFGDHTESIRELLWYFKHSPLVKLSVMAFASKFLLDNEDIIKKDIERNQQKDEK